MSTDPRAALLECAAEGADVAEGALWLAAEDCGDCDVTAALARLDQLASGVAGRLAGVSDRDERARTIGEYLRREVRLRGAGGGDPKAHYLHRVLERGAGVPISCCAVWMGVGRRAGVEVEGVGLPGHFVVRSDGLLVDAFAGGEILDDGAVRRIVGDALGSEPEHLDPRWIMPTSVRSMLARMSRNLRGCYMAREKWELALRAADRCVDLLPDSPAERRDRGLLQWRLGRHTAAAKDLGAYLEAAPEAGDRTKVEDVLRRIRVAWN